jgi:hypothetical protein
MNIECIVEIDKYHDKDCDATIEDLRGFSRVYYIGRKPDAKIEELFHSINIRILEKKTFATIDLYVYSLY